MRARGRPGPGPSVGGVAAELAVEELEVAGGVEVVGAGLARHPPSSASQVEAQLPDGGGGGEGAELAPPRSGAHAKPSVKSALQVCGGWRPRVGEQPRSCAAQREDGTGGEADRRHGDGRKATPGGNKCLRLGV